MKKSQKQGFTLVELSIVLVIIGLLIGGILVAQSLIDSTKIQAFVRQIGQFDGASLTFKDRFGALPGDAQVTGSTNSDADGYIEDATAAILTFDDELPHVFADLSTTGLKNPDGTDYAATDDTVTLGTVIPESAVGVNLGIIAGGSAAEGGNYWWIGDLSGTDGTDMDLDASDSLLAVDALAIDTKMDDADGNAGDVQVDAGDITAADLSTFAADDHDVATPAPVHMRIRLGSSVGNNQ